VFLPGCAPPTREDDWAAAARLCERPSRKSAGQVAKQSPPFLADQEIASSRRALLATTRGRGPYSQRRAGEGPTRKDARERALLTKTRGRGRYSRRQLRRGYTSLRASFAKQSPPFPAHQEIASSRRALLAKTRGKGRCSRRRLGRGYTSLRASFPQERGTGCEAISPVFRGSGDCFVAKGAPRNDAREGSLLATTRGRGRCSQRRAGEGAARNDAREGSLLATTRRGPCIWRANC
jgi:hypothetical protein